MTRGGKHFWRRASETNPAGGPGMKRTIAPTTLVIVFATVLALGIMPRAQAGERRECSNASLRGSFGFTNTGTNLALPPPLAGPLAQIGRQTFDGKGNTHATTTLSANGNILSATAQGTYVVNPDCTGSLTLYISPLVRQSTQTL
jgi:hypothetical protein